MSGRAQGQLFIGRLSKSTRTRDLEDVFERYGPMARCEIKYGTEMGYAFVDFEDRRDAEDALKYENGRDVCGSRIIVVWAKGNPRRPGERMANDDCYRCGRPGHWARDCTNDSVSGYRRQNSFERGPERGSERGSDRGSSGFGGGGGGGGGGSRFRSRSRSPRRRDSRGGFSRHSRSPSSGR